MNRVEALGRAIREVREAVGLSQERLAEKAALHRNSIGMIERTGANQSVPTLLAIADALGVHASQLLARAEELADS